MGKKKKGQQARLLQQWSDTVEANEAAFRDKVKSTVKRQLSRRQRRAAAAAGWGDSSPEREAPGSVQPQPRPGGLHLRLEGDSGSSGSEEEAEAEEERENEGQVRGVVWTVVPAHALPWRLLLRCPCIPSLPPPNRSLPAARLPAGIPNCASHSGRRRRQPGTDAARPGRQRHSTQRTAADPRASALP